MPAGWAFVSYSIDFLTSARGPRKIHGQRWELEPRVDQMMGFDGYDMSGWMWIVMVLVMLVITGALVVLVVFSVRAISGPLAGNSTSALEVLKRRLAAGEITQDDYEKTRRLLEG